MIRRALAEVYADWRHETRAAGTPLARMAAAVGALTAIVRIFSAILHVFDEGHPMRNLGRDFRYALRRLRATPLFSGFAIFTLALGIGVTTAIYSAVHEVSSPPSGVADPGRLVRIGRTVSWPDYQEYLRQQTTFDQVVGWTYFRQAYTANGRSGTGFGEAVSAQYFQALGVRATLGRTLDRDDDREDAPPVTVISPLVWARLFDSAPDVVGRTIKMNGTTFQIVGVVAPEFHGLFNGGLVPSATWVPLRALRGLPNRGATFDFADRERKWLLMTARLAPGRGFEQGAAEVTAISRRINEANPERVPSSSGTEVRRAAPPWITQRMSDLPKPFGTERILAPLIAVLLTAVGLVLLVACTNLANLMLARGAARTHESAIRRAMGASRWRLVRESFVESLLLSAVGGLLAIGVARVLMVVLGAPLDIGGVVLQLEPRLDLPALTAAMLATLLAMVIAGVGPALHASRADVRRILATEGLGARSTRWRGRRYLITGQVAVSVLLVALATLCVRQVIAHGRADTGVDFDRLALVEVDFSQQQYDEPRVRAVVDHVLQQVARDPDIRGASASSGLPVGVGTPGAWIREPQGGAASVEFVVATPDVLNALGVSIVRGRSLDARDQNTTAPVAVINQSTAQNLFGTSDVVGRTADIKRRTWAGEHEWPSEPVMIVGVAADTDAGSVGQRSSGVVYLPFTQHYEGKLVFAARSTGDPARALKSLRQALATTDPDAPVTQALTGASLLGQDTVFFQVVAGFASVLGAMALVLALAGLYGILSFVVSGRTREIGIRIALGADAGLIRRQVLREGLSPVILGLVVGLGFGAIAWTSPLQPALVRLMPKFDLSIFAVVPALFIAAGLVASYLPAWRASRVDANVALKSL